MRSRRGAIILLVSSLAFLISALLFVQLDLKREDAGLLQLELLQAVKMADGARLFLSQAARLSLQNSLQDVGLYNLCKKNPRSSECRQQLERAFAAEFTQYLQTFNMKYQQNLLFDHYTLDVNPEGSTVTEKKSFIIIRATSSDSLLFKGTRFTHKESAHFYLRYELQ